jgi:DNA-binding NarL/FixJ family response regulator
LALARSRPTVTVVRVVLADDLLLLREGLAALMTESGHEVVASVGDGDALLAAVAEHRPDLAVIDVRMPPTHTDEGLRTALELRRRRPDAAILILSQFVEVRYACDLLGGDARGVGYLLKDRVTDIDQFLAAMARVAAGGTVIDPEVISRLLEGQRRDSPVERLTARESQVLALMAEGQTNTAIVQRLEISHSAVEKHVRKVFAKLGLPDSDQHHRRVLAVLAYLNA